jgi:hypothetical protein
MPVDLAILLKQLCEFATLIWLLREAGFAMHTTVFLVPAAVLLLELIAVWTSGRDGSITAPVLALGVALVLRYVAKDSSGGFTRQRARSR